MLHVCLNALVRRCSSVMKPPKPFHPHIADNVSNTVTNAAGSLDSRHQPGDIVLISDHINLGGASPLTGPNDDAVGPRFLALSDAYDLDLRRHAHCAYAKLILGPNKAKEWCNSIDPAPMGEGVYAFVTGPSYETRAEARMLRMLGADMVGMSTVPEVLVARHCGMRVLALSMITNLVVLEPGASGYQVQGMSKEAIDELAAAGKANHQEVIEMGAKGGKMLKVSFQPDVLRIASEQTS